MISVIILGFNQAFALDAIFTPWSNNLAIRGYDPVAYFTDDKAVKGKKKFSWEWQGATWRFANAAHLEMFKTEPNTYAPQYGGYCALAVANNETASTEPEQFAIVDGKLYLNYNAKIKKEWMADPAHFIELADQYWPDLLAD